MIKMTVYCDGGERQKVKGNKITTYQGWGFVAHHNNDTDEVFDGVKLERDSQRGYHELHAFNAAVRYAESYGYIPGEVSFYTDCSWCYEAGFHLHPGNYSKSRAKFIKRLKTFQTLFHPKDKGLVLRLARWLLNAHVCWVKGHSATVYNIRADQLATAGINKAKSRSETLPIFFSHWLEKGFKEFDRVLGEERIVHLPFCHQGMSFVEA